MTVPPATSPPAAAEPPPDDGRVRHVPSEEELAGDWPDPFAGRPQEADEWLAGLSSDELDEMFGPPGDLLADPDLTGAFASPCGAADGLPPGPALAGLSRDIMAAGLGTLADDELIGTLHAARRLAAWQNGVELAAVAELDARRLARAQRPRSSHASEQISEELAAALVLTGRSADLLLGLARDLARLPAVLAALLRGEIDRARAAVFAAELAALADKDARAIAEALAGRAGSWTTGQLRAALRRRVLATDPAALRRRAEKARADARVEAWLEQSGNGALAGRELPAAETLVADQRITAIARALKAAGAAGTLDQLRAAVFTALLSGRDLDSLRPAATHPAPAGTGGAGKSGGGGAGGLAALTGSVHLTMPAAAWLDLTDTPGEIPGLGPLDAWTCRDLAARLAAGTASRWHVTLTDPDGRAAAHACARASPGPRPDREHASRWLSGLTFRPIEHRNCSHAAQVPGYRPPNMIREQVRVRQRTCAFPGCRRPARSCDLDHTIAHEQGGRTCPCNLAPLCRRHHRTKQAPGWRLDQPQPGTLIWTAPHGRAYTVAAGSYPA